MSPRFHETADPVFLLLISVSHLSTLLPRLYHLQMGRFDYNTTKRVAGELVNALEYLNSKNIVHRYPYPKPYSSPCSITRGGGGGLKKVKPRWEILLWGKVWGNF